MAAAAQAMNLNWTAFLIDSLFKTPQFLCTVPPPHAHTQCKPRQPRPEAAASSLVSLGRWLWISCSHTKAQGKQLWDACSCRGSRVTGVCSCRNVSIGHEQMWRFINMHSVSVYSYRDVFDNILPLALLLSSPPQSCPPPVFLALTLTLSLSFCPFASSFSYFLSLFALFACSPSLSPSVISSLVPFFLLPLRLHPAMQRALPEISLNTTCSAEQNLWASFVLITISCEIGCALKCNFALLHTFQSHVIGLLCLRKNTSGSTRISKNQQLWSRDPSPVTVQVRGGIGSDWPIHTGFHLNNNKKNAFLRCSDQHPFHLYIT